MYLAFPLAMRFEGPMMKSLLVLCMLWPPLAGVAIAAQPIASSPIGLWHTVSDTDGKPRAVVEIAEENGGLVGRIVGSLRGEPLDKVCEPCPGERQGKKLIGMSIFSGLKKSGQEWSGGEILDPDTGNVYRVKLWLEDGGLSLKVRGYIGFSLLGRTQKWTRAPSAN
jgi:uncharacterized protein (DUF2147 family)